MFLWKKGKYQIFFLKKKVLKHKFVSTHLNSLNEDLVMNTHNICFCGEIKISYLFVKKRYLIGNYVPTVFFKTDYEKQNHHFFFSIYFIEHKAKTLFTLIVHKTYSLSDNIYTLRNFRIDPCQEKRSKVPTWRAKARISLHQ